MEYLSLYWIPAGSGSFLPLALAQDITPALSGVSLSAINAIERNAKAKAAEQTFILVTWTHNNKPAFVQAIQGCPSWPLWTRGGDKPYECYSSSYRTWMHVPASYVHKLSGEPLFVRTIGVKGSDKEFQLHRLLTHNKPEPYIYSLSTPSIRCAYQASSMSTSSFPPSSVSSSSLHRSSSSASTSSIASIPKKVGKHDIICIELSDNDDGEVFFVGQQYIQKEAEVTSTTSLRLPSRGSSPDFPYYLLPENTP
ncbi:hypothetical protein B0H17DRAFT_1209070 [Mycena rosella]|uniref:Uncharacterized protein n=1 Tax=Mycena rosella TaxID=1033263 RepID=A0AAD7GAI0_MYCRO|nr:hypothetical protein B0H17DRAFT_1209070 [Mycena rosella]